MAGDQENKEKQGQSSQQGGQKGTPGTQAGSMGSRHGSTGNPQGSFGSQQGGQSGQRSQGTSSQGTQGMQGGQGTQQFTDPVCGMKVDKGKFGGTSSYQGQTYHFCSEGCKEKFERSPQQYAKRTA